MAAEICSLPGISGHADREGLLEWAGAFEKKPEKVFVVHGDDAVVDPFARLLHEKLGLDAYAPYSGTVWDLLENKCLFEAKGIPFVKKDAEGHPVKGAAAGTVSGPYVRLEHAAERLMAVVRANRGGANKDLAKFADQIAALCDKWER